MPGPRPLLFALLAATVVLTGCTNPLSTTATPDDGPEAEEAEPTFVPSRQLPDDAVCGSTMTIAIEAQPPNGTTAWLAEETLPDGWTVEEANGSFAVQTDAGVKFAHAGANATTITYDVVIPEDADGTYTLAGEYRFHPSMDDRDPLSGDERLTVRCAG